jgi:hypothetical protein
MAEGFYKMYLSSLGCDIEKELDSDPVLKESLKGYDKKFISWCAKQRFLFEADLQDEVEAFLNKYVRCRLYNVNNGLWKAIQKQVFERDAYVCQYCGRTGGQLEVDHINPVSNGGTNQLDNLATACRRCNRQKRNKTVEQFNVWRSSQ